MKRAVAWGFYLLGAILALRNVALALSGDSIFEGLLGIAFGVAVWWIAVGFGVRLGMHPDEFIASIKSALGFGEDFETPEASPETARE